MEKETLQNSNYKVVCTKHNIILQKDIHKQYVFVISFCTKPAKGMFTQLKSHNLYYLLGKLNPDIITNIDIINGNTSKQNTLLTFKRFGKEFGLSQKFLYLKNEFNYIDESLISTKASSIHCSNPPDKCTMINAKYADFLIKKIKEHIVIEFKFNLDLQEDLPNYMKNLPGLLMKKIFIRVKNYIETGHE